MARKLASIRKIANVFPIKGKDRVEMVVVDGWTCMVSKSDNFKIGDTCIFCEPDSVFPPTEEWEFLKKYNYRIKTQKFKDSDGNPIYSQGLVLPTTKVRFCFILGDDVTSELNITQYEATRDVEPEKKYKNPLMRYSWFRKLTGKSKQVNGDFPSEISKTDEIRIQNASGEYKKADVWVATEKVDGQSGTFLLKKRKCLFGRVKYEFTVCSRNFSINDKETSYWIVAEKYNIKSALESIIGDNEWVCLQGEILGPKIQKNKYKFDEYVLKGFNLIYPDGRVPTQIAANTCKNIGIEWVPILGEFDMEWFDCKSVNEVLSFTNGISELNKDVKREGIVFRSFDGKYSFKVVSPEFLIKYDE